uniref:Galanin receptor n=1 Tax=Rattus norvegicus TaxID=10116 RepID=Q62828_RAT|nr:galanin receptor [Rattus norvegicus]
MELAPVNLSEGNGSDPEPPAEPRPLFGIGVENFITLVVFGLIFAMGVLGNSLVITVLARSKPGKPRSTTNLFILNLSIADLGYLLFCIPFQATVYALPTWVLGAFICKFIHYFFTVSMLVSIFTLAAMSVDRYVAIVHSRRSSSLRVSRQRAAGRGPSSGRCPSLWPRRWPTTSAFFIGTATKPSAGSTGPTNSTRRLTWCALSSLVTFCPYCSSAFAMPRFSIICIKS